MENFFGLARIFGSGFFGGFVVPDFGVSRLLQPARTAVLLTLFATSYLTVLTTTSNAANLPDGRAYELVSPPDKGGSDVIQQTAKTHVSPDGNGVTFSAVGAFGDLQGTSFDTEYVSHRTGVPGTSGWSTSGINPPGASDTFPAAASSNTPSFVNAFTPDLSFAVYQSWHPLTDAPNVAEFENLYRIDGLGGGSETATLMSDSVAPPLANWSANVKLLIQPALVGASSDLRHVVFESPLALTTDAAPYQGFFCVFLGFGCATQLYENANGTVRLVGRIPNGTDTCDDSNNAPACVSAESSQAGISATARRYSQQMVSQDGRRVFFQVPAGGESGAIYMREDGVRTVQLAPNGQLWAASADGSRVFFITSDSLITDDTDAGPDLYMYDANTPARPLTLISASTFANGNAGGVFGVSADGHYVYFVCDGQLLAGEPPADLGGLYVWHDGSLAYIGTLHDAGEVKSNGPRTEFTVEGTTSTSRVSPDGQHLLFMTRNDAGFRGRGGFAGYDHAGYRELYLYSAVTGRLVCASCNPSGIAATADALTDQRKGAAVSAKTSKLSHALSDDGNQVFFSTAEALVSDDTNGRPDAYEYDAVRGTVHLISSGTDSSPSYFVDASNDGSNAFFVTRQRLVGWDVDNSYDLYDARIHGGFPEPSPAPPACVGEGCLPQGSRPPVAGLPSSATYSGAGNITPTSPGKAKPKRKCPLMTVARRVKGKTRCLRRAHKHTTHINRASRGASNQTSGR
jgi:hypothetical protein